MQFLPLKQQEKLMILRAKRRTPLRVETSQQAFSVASTEDMSANTFARSPRAQAATGDSFSPRAPVSSGPAQPTSHPHLLLNTTSQQSMNALVARICRNKFLWRFEGIAVSRQLSSLITPVLQSNSQVAWAKLTAPMLPLAQDSQATRHHKAWICNLFGSVLILKAARSELGAPNEHRRVPAAAFQSALKANESLTAALNGGLHFSTALNLHLNRVQLVSWLSRY
jgi:hypothetical protein